MPKSSEKDRTVGYIKLEGEIKTSESWPTLSASQNNKIIKTQNISSNIATPKDEIQKGNEILHEIFKKNNLSN